MSTSGSGTGTPSSGTSPAATSLLSLAQARLYLNIADSSVDAIIGLLIDGVSSKFNRYLDRALAQTVYTALYLDGSGAQELWLPSWPVKSITSLAENGGALTEGAAADYLLYSEAGVLFRRVCDWTSTKKGLLLTYTAGYIVQGATPAALEIALPEDIKLAALKQVAAEYQQYVTKSFRDVSRSYPDGSVSYADVGELLKEVREVLNKYRRLSI